MTRFSNSLSDALLANGPAQDRREKMGLYGWLIGDWTMEATVHLSGGNTNLGCGEIHFGWVLELGGCRTKRFRI